MKQTVRFGRMCFAVMAAWLLAVGLACGVCAAGSEPKDPLILVEVASPDENGYFDVTVSAENLEFLVSEIALRYDTKTVCPVDADGESAKAFSDFAKAASFDGVSRIGEKADTEKAIFSLPCLPIPAQKRLCLGYHGSLRRKDGALPLPFQEDRRR